MFKVQRKRGRISEGPDDSDSKSGVHYTNLVHGMAYPSKDLAMAKLIGSTRARVVR